MPVVVVVDSSLSMCRYALEAGEVKVSRLQLAEDCAVKILDHVTSKFKLEHIAALSISSEVNLLCDFTRDYVALKTGLRNIKVGDKADFGALTEYLNQFVVKTWGRMQPCPVLIITDGGIMSNKKLKLQEGNTLFEFPCKLHFLCVESFQSLKNCGSYDLFQEAIKKNNESGSIIPLYELAAIDISISAVVSASVVKFLNKEMKNFEATLSCGNLSSRVSIFPTPEEHKSPSSALKTKLYSIDDELKIVGFLNISDVRNPPVLSRHLLLPVNPVETEQASLVPSFSVVLHGSLKMESKVALVKLSSEWYGIVYSWADSKTKSNLVLSILPVGLNSIPWLGNFNHLAPASFLPANPSGKKSAVPSFPVQSKRFTKRSYSQPTVAWTRATGLQTDVQKILRSAKKLPEKSHVFYKDLNRLRRAALSFGFHGLLDGISSLLERECTLLPGTAHPEATLQLSHAARELKSTINKGHEHTIEPLKTDFKFQGLKS